MTDRLLIKNARLLDPASGLDGPGDVMIEGRRIADFGPHIGDVELGRKSVLLCE